MGGGERSGRGPLDRRVLDLAPALRTHVAICAVLAVAVAGAVLGQAEALARLLPRLVDGDASAVGPTVVALAVAACVRAGAAAVVERSATRAVQATRRAVRDEVLDRLARLRSDHRAALGPARVLGLTSGAAEALDPWVRSYLPALVLAAVVPAAAGLRILAADRLSAVVLLVVVPLVPVFMVLIGRATEARAARQWAALQRLSGRFLDTLAGLPTLRLFGRAEAQVARIEAVTERYRATTMRTLRIAFLSALVLELLATMSVALVAVSLGIRLTHGGLDLSTALVVLLLAPECLMPLRRVSAAFHAATSGVDAAAEVEAVLALPERRTGTEPVPAGGALEVDGAAVVDDARGVRLAPTSLVVEPGRMVALTGPSGAGKSTLIDVARGAIAPTDGAVRLGGRDVGTFGLGARAAALRWVPQRPHALGATVTDSAALGHPAGPATDAAVVEALGTLGLAGHAGDPPDRLSGGERRRLGLARALVGVILGEVCVLLVDEPTAQLDEESAALGDARRTGVGVLVATHDPRLVAAAEEEVTLASSDLAAPGAPRPSVEPGAPAAVAEPAPTTPQLWTEVIRGGQVRSKARWDGGRGALRWLVRTTGVPWRRLIVAHALGLAAEACTVGLAGTAAWLVVRAAERPSFADLAVAAVVVRACGLGKGAFRYAERLASHDVTFRLLARLRAGVVARLAHLAPTGLPEGGRGDTLQRLVADVDRLQDLPLRVVGPATSALGVAVGAVGVVAVLDVRAGLVLASAVGLVGAALPAAAYRHARRAGEDEAAARGALAGATVALAEDVEELVGCGAEPGARAEIERRAGRIDALERRRSRLDATLAAVAAAAPPATVAGVVAAVGPARTGLSGPALAVVVLLPLAVVEALGPLAAAGTVLAAVRSAAERVRSLVENPDPVAEPGTPAPIPADAGLVVDGLAVAWPGSGPVFAGVDLAVAEGERALVVGASGSGKSTLAAALVRFLPEAAGQIRVGGIPAAELGGDAVRRLVTWCPQDPWFADTTLADNLRIARPGAADGELWQVLATVHLDGWARSLPEGLETRLARDAEAMSGGERQRLALARGLLGDRRAIVLDEPTSHLDVDTAAVVLDDLLAATHDRAVVVLGHDATEVGWTGRSVRITARARPTIDPGAPTLLVPVTA